MAKASDNEFPRVLLVPTDPSTQSIPSGTEGLVLDSTDSNKLKRVDDLGAVTDIEGGGGGGLSAIANTVLKVTSGDKTLLSTSYAAVDSGGAFDITIAAAAGDILEIGLAAILGSDNQATSNNVNFTARTRVSSADANTISGATASVTAWFGSDVPSGRVVTVAGTTYYTVVSGDISGGNVTLRLYYRTDVGTAGYGRTMFANSTNPSVLSVKNLRH